ncbi:hypothetical protein OD917_09405 [Flavobacterium sp. SH_e]|uniref:hypothetical protein n=1 Tax=Flavobacterium TaxID=237 RepID=UPI0021E3E24B|nr:hypothetical protein [Flavobacterium sp. SH_e]MCV2485138.1 hypothetical protein [Flavobacterium sp. SH_e]
MVLYSAFIASIKKYSFDYKVDKGRRAYHLHYKIINKNKVEVSIYDTFPGKIWDYILTQ